MTLLSDFTVLTLMFLLALVGVAGLAAILVLVILALGKARRGSIATRFPAGREIKIEPPKTRPYIASDHDRSIKP